jgi:hypothetical protein
MLDAPLEKAIAAARAAQAEEHDDGYGAEPVKEAEPAEEEEPAPPQIPQPDLARSDSATWDIFGALPTPNQSSGDLAAQGRGASPPPPPQEISQEDILAGLSSASPAPPVAPAAAVSFDPFG